jgi:hypothetical protein
MSTSKIDSPTLRLSHRLRADAGRRLPAARMEILLSQVDRHLAVELVYVRVEDRERRALTRSVFDDGAACVDRNAGGEIVGVEFPYCPPQDALTGYEAACRRGSVADASLLRGARATAAYWWATYTQVTVALNRYKLAPKPERTARALFDLASAHPSSDRWKPVLEAAQGRR